MVRVKDPDEAVPLEKTGPDFRAASEIQGRAWCANLWNISPGGWLECVLPKGHESYRGPRQTGGHLYPDFSAFYQRPRFAHGPFRWVYDEGWGWTLLERRLDAQCAGLVFGDFLDFRFDGEMA